MPTALEQQAQFQQILRDSLAPIFEYTVASQRSQNLADELRNRANIAAAGEAGALERTKIGAQSHIEGIQEQAKAIFERADKKEKSDQLKKLRATITQNPKENDEDYFVRAMALAPSLLDNADANIEELSNKSLEVSKRGEAENLLRARTVAANSIRPFLSPTGANHIIGLLSKGVAPEQVIAEAQRDLNIFQKLWSDPHILPAQQQLILGNFQQAYDAALAKPQYSAPIQTEIRNTEEKLKTAVAKRELLRANLPEAWLGQAAKGVGALPALDVKSLVSGGGKDQFMGPPNPTPAQAALLPLRARGGSTLPATPPELQPGYTKGFFPTLASALPIDEVRSAAASLAPLPASGARNLRTALFGGNYDTTPAAHRIIGDALGDYLSRLGAPREVQDPTLTSVFGRMVQSGLASQVNPAMLPALTPATTQASQFGRFANAIRNPFAAQQVPAELTTVPNPAPSPDEEALMRELAPFLYPNQ